MRRASILVAALFLAGSLLVRAAVEPPRLLVVVVLDQFRAEYLTTFSSHWRAGFKTLLDEGMVFRQARYPYLHTDTCAGHTTIGTGALPRTHGMIADQWYDRDLHRNKPLCTDDEEAKPITYERPSKLGDSGKAILVPTLADELRVQRPGSRVVTLSLKADAAVGLAGHGGTAVTWFDDVAGTFATSEAYASAPVPEVKRFVDSFPYERDLGSLWSLRDPASLYRNADAGLGERPPASWTGLFPHALKGQMGADAQFTNLWRRSPMSDAYLGRLAQALIDDFSLGQRGGTDYLGVSFSATDLVGHLFGPDSREVEDVAARLDDVLGALIGHLDRSVGRSNYVLALSADHGVAAIPVGIGGRVAPEDVRDRIEDTLRSAYGPLETGTYVEANYIGDMYLSSAVSKRLAADVATVQRAQKAVAAIPGIDRLLYTPSLSQPRDALERAAAASSVPARNGDFVATVKPSWVFVGRATPNATGHGTEHAYDQRVPLIFFGAGLRHATLDAAVTPADIAPTLARLAGIKLEKADGRVLEEALSGTPQIAERATRN